MNIREATHEDFEAIRHLNRVAYQEYIDMLLPEHGSRMMTGVTSVEKIAETGVWIIAEANDQIVGAVAYFPPHNTSNSSIFPPEWAYLRLLGVAPAHRGAGIGKRLTEYCIEQAKRDGAAYIGLHTSEAMHTARSMYEHMGFQQDRELPEMFGLCYWRYGLPLSRYTHE